MKESKKANKKATKGFTSSVQGCSFVGVQWDAKSLDGVNAVAAALARNADALKENALALQDLIKLFRSQNVRMGPLLSIGGGERASIAHSSFDCSGVGSVS